MRSPDEARHALARRLKALREERWPHRKITQAQLAEALRVSGPAISGWESATNPQLPPEGRLEGYATFFATERSVARRPFQIVELRSEDERAARDTLLDELTRLRAAASGEASTPAYTLGGFWRYPSSQDVTIIGSELPASERQKMPNPNIASPDHVELYKFSDLDALLELHGHIRAANPTNQVNIRTPSELVTDDYTTHLVVLGGVDWNVTTEELMENRIDLPVTQLVRKEASDAGGFEVDDGDDRRLIEPEFQRKSGNRVLVADVAHFYRGQNPFNEQRTITICNGMYVRGTLGAVRALTDARLRGTNEAYLRERFGDRLETLSIITRVPIVRGKVITPDWTNARNRLHEWPEA